MSLLPAVSSGSLPSEPACALSALSHCGMRPSRSTAHSKFLAEPWQPAGFRTCLLAIYDPAEDGWQPAGLGIVRNRDGCAFWDRSGKGKSAGQEAKTAEGSVI